MKFGVYTNPSRVYTQHICVYTYRDMCIHKKEGCRNGGAGGCAGCIGFMRHEMAKQ